MKVVNYASGAIIFDSIEAGYELKAVICGSEGLNCAVNGVNYPKRHASCPVHVVRDVVDGANDAVRRMNYSEYRENDAKHRKIFE
jgi:hypothetical protein